jgi:hypothetical protein
MLESAKRFFRVVICLACGLDVLSNAHAALRVWPINSSAISNAGNASVASYSAPEYHYASNSPELKITRSGNGAFVMFPGDPYDIVYLFASARLRTNAPRRVLADWVWLGRSKFNEKAVLLTNLWPDAQFLKIGTLRDSDNDLLPDTFEILVSHTDPTKRDTDGNNVEDGDESGPRVLPWKLEQDAWNDIVVFADRPVTEEGGACGRILVHLPAAASPDGQTVQFRFWGTAQLGLEYVTKPSGNTLLVPAGAQTAYIEVCAVDDRKYADLDLYMEIHVTNAPGATYGRMPARVDIRDNDFPDVRVFAFPQHLPKPSVTEGTNKGGFFFIRDGDSFTEATTSFSIGGTARSSVDYEPLTNRITFPANVRTNLLPLIPKFTRDPSDKTIVLTITNTPKYQVDPKYGKATMTLEIQR